MHVATKQRERVGGTSFATTSATSLSEYNASV